MINKSDNCLSPERRQEIIELLRKEVKPALGCTEPIAVALAVAKSAEAACCGGNRQELLSRPDSKIKVAVSGNILKNGMGVGIPGTGSSRSRMRQIGIRTRGPERPRSRNHRRSQKAHRRRQGRDPALTERKETICGSHRHDRGTYGNY